MTNSIKDLEKSQKEITVQIPAAEMEKYVEKALDRIQSSVELDGFRKGKAPKNIVKQKVGDMKIFEEASHIAIEESYLEIITANKEIVPLGQPKAEIIKMAPGNDFEYKMVIAVMPKIELGDYKKVTGKIEVKEIEDKKIEDELAGLQKRKSVFITKDEAADKGDRVEIDFEVRIDGVKIEGGESKNHPLVVGENKFIPGFEEQLVGMKKDDVKEFELKFPENYKEGLADKMASFKVTMNIVQKVEVPELNDEFAKSLGEEKGLEELKKNIRKSMEHEAEHHAEHELEHKLLDQITTDMKVEIPEVLISAQLNDMVAEFRGNLSQAGMDFEQYLETANATMEGIREEWKPLAEKKVKENLAIREIASRENIKAEEDEVTLKVDQTLKYYPNEEEIRGKIDMHRFRDYIAGDILRGKVVEFLRGVAEKN
jgi:trigger factor